MSDKHAYLIMAHNQPELLQQLLKALDHPKNDIYLHLDKKMQVCSRQLQQQVRVGRLFLMPRRLDVKWGDFSQILCELQLLEAATREEHAYYHLMSGVDLPLKSQDQIHQFFRENSGVEFVQFQKPEIGEEEKLRVSKYHFFIKRREAKKWWEKALNKVFLVMQRGIDRTRRDEIAFQKGANWFSITHNLAKYVLSQQKFIFKTFQYSLCGDEMFLQTIVYNSRYKANVAENNYCDNYENILYCIDWKRGNPHEFTLEDYDALMSSDMLFARKFNWNKDREVICRIADAVAAGDQEWGH